VAEGKLAPAQRGRCRPLTACDSLRWQVFSDNTGYDYKNTVANGVFMQLAARLSRYTGNSTYGDWAGTVFSWLEDLQLIDTTTWLLADGAHVEDNCTDVDHAYWSYSPAIAIYTAAVMHNISSDAVWETRLAGILNSTAQHFFSPYANATDIMFEAQC
jgi:mannan endo-1,6-alpha-mannosidase